MIIYERIFTLGSIALLAILIPIYFQKQQFNYARNKIFKALTILTVVLCIVELSYTSYLWKAEINQTIETILYKMSFFLHIIWFDAYFTYFETLVFCKDAKSWQDVVKQNKITKFALVYVGIATAVWFLIPYDGQTNLTLDFLNGYTFYYFIFHYIILNGLMLFNVYKAKDLKKMEKFALYFSTMVIMGMVLVQKAVTYFSLIPYAYTIICYIIYLNSENPDITFADEIKGMQGDIDKSNQTKSDFLSNMTLEIKSPMSLIRSLCDELINMPTYDEKLFKENISQIVLSGNSLLDIVNNILDISKIETGKAVLMEKEYKVVDLLTDVVNITKSKIGAKQVKLIINADKNISSVLYGDYSKLYQALVNVLNNSAKFTEVGRITFTLSSTKSNNVERLLFKITDTGTGIREEDQEKIFIKGTRLDNATEGEIEGNGFGLVITKDHVDTLGGKIWFESKYRVGSTFFIEVPQKIVDATPMGNTLEQQQAKPATGTEEKLDCSKFTVLIVDDNLLNIKVAKRVLEKYKFNVESVTAGKDCVYKIKEGTHYDAIFMDHMMPEMDGIETLHVLKKLDGYELPPIIALTANAVAGMKEMYLAEGFDDYLSKPIQTNELDRVVNKFFNK